MKPFNYNELFGSFTWDRYA